MRTLCLSILICILVACDNNSQYIPPPETLKEADLVGTWQATYGVPQTKDTIILNADGTYEQIFQSPDSDYYYESSGNRWYIESSHSGKPKLHLEGMRYYASAIRLGESGGRNSDGTSALFYDIDEGEVIEMTDKVILRIKGDDNFPKGFPRGIILWHMSIDPDGGARFFTLVN